jgi:hypothetical protein
VSETKDFEVMVKPGEEVLYLLKKTPGSEPASYKAQFFPRLNHQAACSPEEIRNLGKKSQIEEVTPKGETVDRH